MRLFTKFAQDKHQSAMRQQFHRMFDPIWKKKLMKRHDAYELLCERCGFYAHGEFMTAEQCRIAILEAGKMKYRLMAGKDA